VEKYKDELEKDFRREQRSKNKDKTQEEGDQEKAKRKAEREREREERSKSKDRPQQKFDKEKEREMRSQNKDAASLIRDKQERIILEEVKEEKKIAYEEKLINGELRVQVGKGYNLANLLPEGYKYFYLEFKLEGVNQDESFSSKPIEYYTKKNFKWSIKVPLISCHPEDLGDEFNIKINASKNTFENSQLVGEIF
jgi:flagellar biosynthesis GTPase FlhF